MSLTIRTLAVSSVTAVAMAVDELFEPFVVRKRGKVEV